jgi:hypothetical protein
MSSDLETVPVIEFVTRDDSTRVLRFWMDPDGELAIFGRIGDNGPCLQQLGALSRDDTLKLLEFLNERYPCTSAVQSRSAKG